MAQTPFAPNLTRVHWAGTDADLDIHIEKYEGLIDASFAYESMFRGGGLTRFVSVQNQTNTWRGERLGAVKVKGRRSGETLDDSRVVNDKFNIQVDVTSYIRTPMDYNDEWTAPDRSAEISSEHGIAHAKAFDTAHLIQLIKAGAWKAPQALKDSGSFYDGIQKTLTGYAQKAASSDYADRAAAADILVKNHKDVIAEFVKRDLGGSVAELLTLVDPDTFNVLLDHNKLMNMDWGGVQAGNSIVMRRVAYINGTRIMETPRFPTTAISNHYLGPNFNVSAAEAKARMIVFLPRLTLVTVEAKGMTVVPWNDHKNMTNVMDTYTMFNVGIRRGDACAVLYSD